MSDAKLVREQIKNVLDEKLPEILQEEVIKAISKKVDEHLVARLKQIEGHIGETLKRIDERSKDVQSFIVRELTKAVPNAEKQEIKANEETEQEASQGAGSTADGGSSEA